GAQPFQPAPEAAAPPRRVAPKTALSRVRGMGETTPAGDDAIEKARAAAAPPVSLPPFTLRQYASLCAELAFWPDQRAAVLEYYQIRDHAEHTALDAHWRRERAASPETRAAFEQDFASYTAWLHANRR